MKPESGRGEQNISASIPVRLMPTTVISLMARLWRSTTKLQRREICLLQLQNRFSLERATASVSTASRVALALWVAILELGRREFLHNGVKLFAVRSSMRTAAYLAGICLGIITHDVERWLLITSVASALVESFQVIFERVEVIMKAGSIQYFVRVHREN